jgi:hypothetical protein
MVVVVVVVVVAVAVAVAVVVVVVVVVVVEPVLLHLVHCYRGIRFQCPACLITDTAVRMKFRGGRERTCGAEDAEHDIVHEMPDVSL